MKDIEDKNIEFVARHYEPNKLDTQKALDEFRRERGIHRPKSNLLLRLSGVAASIAIAIFALMPKSEMVSITAEGETVVAYLPDSTKVMLADGSTLSYDARDYAGDSRHVDMSGEAFFSVTRNELSPFKVATQNATVEVLGTQFLLDDNGENTELYVESGKVRFSTKDESASLVLTKGMSAELDSHNRISIAKPTTTNPAAWATGKFVYENTPISEVLNELSHFYGVRLTTTDTTKYLTATFSTTDLANITPIIETALGITISKID